MFNMLFLFSMMQRYNAYFPIQRKFRALYESLDLLYEIECLIKHWSVKFPVVLIV